MSISLTHVRRYTEIMSLLWKYGRSDLAQQMSAEHGVEPPPDAPVAAADAAPAQLADDLEAMGPTYVKLGQVLSSRPDLLPDAYAKALARLQDQVDPFPYAEVEEIVSTELGVRISKAFSRFDPVPIAAASLGQVHSAALRDGREVVVKVQRPGIAQQIAGDFEVLEQIAGFMDAHTEVGRRHRFLRMLEEFRVTIQRELNYEREAQNLVALGANLKEFTLIQVPQPVPDYSSLRVLTMDLVRGRKITSVGPIVRLDVNGEPLVEELFKAYLQQVLVDGLFHADPHPGNVFLTDDGRIALLDLGMVGHTSPAMQQHLVKLMLAISDSNSDAAAETVIQMSETTEDSDVPEFRRRITQIITANQGQVVQQINVGQSLIDVARQAAAHSLYPPSELALLGKTLVQLDEIAKTLDPRFDPAASIRRNVAELMSQRMNKTATQGSLFSSLLEAREFVSGLPARLNRIMDAVSNHELEVRVKAADATLMMDGFQKIANRITTGIVLAALIVGASLLMQVQTRFTLMGYPGLAILCFTAAAAGGFWLVVSIFVQDRRRRPRP